MFSISEICKTPAAAVLGTMEYGPCGEYDTAVYRWSTLDTGGHGSVQPRRPDNAELQIEVLTY